MMVHRLLERYLAGGRSVIQKKYEDLCDHCSNMEQVAANAERASIKYKQVEFMQDKLGMVFGRRYLRCHRMGTLRRTERE
mgnify:CR=1 FL=1